jgi:L,D-peptidoglycan transpeptidase YkuD (ErfK/YbiS/YcfS/YnhG family)
MSRHSVVAAVAALGALVPSVAAHAAPMVLTSATHPARAAARFSIPATADQLIVVSSPNDDPPPPEDLATLRTYQRANGSSPWRAVFPAWQAETGSGHLLQASKRREGDHATPIGVFGIGATMYGNAPNPGGLSYPYHHLVCGDWWDEDPYSSQYNDFVHRSCDAEPEFADWSEALWTETVAYPYFAVIRFNESPTVSGPNAPGAGIFLHSWVGAATEGCVALRVAELLRVLRWLKPSEHPLIEIGTNSQINAVA